MLFLNPNSRLFLSQLSQVFRELEKLFANWILEGCTWSRRSWGFQYLNFRRGWIWWGWSSFSFQGNDFRPRCLGRIRPNGQLRALGWHWRWKSTRGRVRGWGTSAPRVIDFMGAVSRAGKVVPRRRRFWGSGAIWSRADFKRVTRNDYRGGVRISAPSWRPLSILAWWPLPDCSVLTLWPLCDCSVMAWGTLVIVAWRCGRTRPSTAARALFSWVSWPSGKWFRVLYFLSLVITEKVRKSTFKCNLPLVEEFFVSKIGI